LIFLVKLVALLRLKVGVLGLISLLGLVPTATQATLAQRARHHRSAIQTSLSCAHSSSCSIYGIAGESNEREVKVVRFLQTSRRLFSSAGYLHARRQPENSAVLRVNFAL
jgi:hypothetical protein